MWWYDGQVHARRVEQLKLDNTIAWFCIQLSWRGPEKRKHGQPERKATSGVMTLISNNNNNVLTALEPLCE
jgi:hypothetical protein